MGLRLQVVSIFHEKKKNTSKVPHPRLLSRKVVRVDCKVVCLVGPCYWKQGAISCRFGSFEDTWLLFFSLKEYRWHKKKCALRLKRPWNVSTKAHFDSFCVFWCIIGFACCTLLKSTPRFSAGCRLGQAHRACTKCQSCLKTQSRHYVSKRLPGQVEYVFCMILQPVHPGVLWIFLHHHDNHN